ncbi:MAG: 2-amino-4-hydroxy-6-hydroxymethyldihydropteridine diphosphokinase [Bacteroidota bacterium]
MQRTTHQLYLSIGGNLGQRKANLAKAIELTSEEMGMVSQVSPIYETKAWGVENQPDFLNQALLVETMLSPEAALSTVLKIEAAMGRVRERKWYTRLIDIDILFYDDLVINTPKLTVPHPFIANRNFVLAPLADIAPDFIHPVLQKSVRELYRICKDPLPVTTFLSKYTTK